MSRYLVSRCLDFSLVDQVMSWFIDLYELIHFYIVYINLYGKVILIKDELFCDWKSSHKSVPFWLSLEMAPVSTEMNGLRCTAWENRLAAQ